MSYVSINIVIKSKDYLGINETLAPVSSFPRPQKVPPPVAVPPILVNLSSASTLRTETPEPMVTRR